MSESSLIIKNWCVTTQTILFRSKSLKVSHTRLLTLIEFIRFWLMHLTGSQAQPGNR